MKANQNEMNDVSVLLNFILHHNYRILYGKICKEIKNIPQSVKH